VKDFDRILIDLIVEMYLKHHWANWKEIFVLMMISFWHRDFHNSMVSKDKQ